MDNLRTGAIIAMVVWMIADNMVIMRNLDATGRRKDRGSVFVIMAVNWIGWTAGFWLAYTPLGRITHLPVLIQSIGFAVFVAGVILRSIAIRQLGHFHSPMVELKDDHHLVDAGLYRLVRHPSYLGALIAITGIALCMANWYSLLIMPVAAFIGYLYRIHAEEGLLMAELGEPYRAYAARTRRLIPWIY